MSKFIDRLKQVSQPAASPLGFHARKQSAPRPRLQLVAHLEIPPKSTTPGLAAADAVITSAGGAIPEDASRGTWLSKGTAEEFKQAADSGADFVIVPGGGAAMPADNNVGRILVLDAMIGDTLLRAANDLPIDAVFVAGEGKSIADLLSGEATATTWQKLLFLQRFAAMLTKPVLVSVPVTITAAELQLIWDTGVAGLVVHVSGDADLNAFAVLREHIDGLQYPSPKKKGPLFASVPQLAERHEEEPEEDEDE